MMKIERRYTKKQILESLYHWMGELKKLEESTLPADKNPEVKQLLLEQLLDELDIFDEWGSWSDVSGPSLSLVKFSDESLQKLKEAFAGMGHWKKALGLSKVMSREEYVEETQYWDGRVPSYEDYIEDEIYKFEEAFERDGFSKLFKPAKVLVLDNVQLNHDSGKTVLAALYAIL